MAADRPLTEGTAAGHSPLSPPSSLCHDGRRAAIDALYRAPETDVAPALIEAATIAVRDRRTGAGDGAAAGDDLTREQT